MTLPDYSFVSQWIQLMSKCKRLLAKCFKRQVMRRNFLKESFVYFNWNLKLIVNGYKLICERVKLGLNDPSQKWWFFLHNKVHLSNSFTKLTTIRGVSHITPFSRNHIVEKQQMTNYVLKYIINKCSLFS